MGAPIPVGGTLNPGAVSISTTAAKPYQLSNSYSSPNNVYIGTDPSVSETNYVRELVPGESFTWTEINLPVYAYCKPLETASVVVAYEATGSASPGRSIISVNNSSSVIQVYTGDITSGLPVIVDAYYDVPDNANSIIISFFSTPVPGVFTTDVIKLSVIWIDTNTVMRNEIYSAQCSTWGNVAWTVPRKSNRFLLTLEFPAKSCNYTLEIVSSPATVEKYTHKFVAEVQSVQNATVTQESLFGHLLQTKFTRAATPESQLAVSHTAGINSWVAASSGGTYAAITPVNAPNNYLDITTTFVSGVTPARALLLPNVPLAFQISSTGLLVAFTLTSP